jgi:SAM-dependent methyltransferase
VKEILLEQEARIADMAQRKGVLGHIHERDMLFDFFVRSVFLTDRAKAVDAYFEGGEDCCRRFAALCAEHVQGTVGTVLEFASGYGRVARHAHHMLPATRWICCDIHLEAVEYVRSRLALEAFHSSTRPDAWDTGGRQFDVVFALSFFSHMPHSTFGDWLERLLDAVAPGGLLIFTTHGEVSESNMRAGGMEARFDESGFFWHPASDQRDLALEDYGTSAVTLSYVHRALQRHSKARLIRYQQAWWWGHQDLYVVRRTA